MSKIGLSFVLVFSLVAAPLFISCKNSTGPNSLTIVKPVAGEIIKAGSTYTIQWEYPQNWAYTQVRVKVSISNKSLFIGKDVVPSPSTIDYPQSTFQWTVPSDTSGDSCQVKVEEYGENAFCYSGIFKITR